LRIDALIPKCNELAFIDETRTGIQNRNRDLGWRGTKNEEEEGKLQRERKRKSKLDSTQFT
jgi:hypothetical protein